jgi:hypothetical protein
MLLNFYRGHFRLKQGSVIPLALVLSESDFTLLWTWVDHVGDRVLGPA